MSLSWAIVIIIATTFLPFIAVGFTVWRLGEPSRTDDGASPDGA